MEVAKGFYTDDPGRMLEILDATGAFPRVMPGLVYKPRLRAQLAAAARAGLDIAARFGVLCHLSPAPQEVGRHMRAPGECQDFARLLPTLLAGLAAIQTKPSRTEKPLLWLELMEQCDALRKPDRFMALVAADACVTEADIDVPAWEDRVSAIRGVDAGAIARPLGGQPEHIKAALRDARLKALSARLTTDGDGRRE
jgi:tRNA nucleotidyltransferase (CCA-adding enzyme)